MKAALSIVLAALLIILPVEQVLAQAAQQADVRVQQAAPSDGAARLFRVPPLTENSARLLRTSSDRALLDSDFADARPVQEHDEGGLAEWEVWVLAVTIVGFVIGIYLLVKALESAIDLEVPIRVGGRQN